MTWYCVEESLPAPILLAHISLPPRLRDPRGGASAARFAHLVLTAVGYMYIYIWRRILPTLSTPPRHAPAMTTVKAVVVMLGILINKLVDLIGPRGARCH